MRIAILIVLSFLLTWLFKYLDTRSRLLDLIIEDVAGWITLMIVSALILCFVYLGLKPVIGY